MDSNGQWGRSSASSVSSLRPPPDRPRAARAFHCRLRYPATPPYNRLPAAYPAISKHLHLPNNSCHILHLGIDGTSFVSLLCIIILHYHISVMPDDCQQPLAFILHPIVSTRVLLVELHCRYETKLSAMCCSSDVLQHLAQV
jgi:hypothetical protein